MVCYRLKGAIWDVHLFQWKRGNYAMQRLILSTVFTETRYFLNSVLLSCIRKLFRILVGGYILSWMTDVPYFVISWWNNVLHLSNRITGNKDGIRSQPRVSPWKVLVLLPAECPWHSTDQFWMTNHWVRGESRDKVMLCLGRSWGMGWTWCEHRYVLPKYHCYQHSPVHFRSPLRSVCKWNKRWNKYKQFSRKTLW